MSSPTLSNASLHYTLIRHIIDRGHAPNLAELAAHFQASETEVVSALHKLHADHGVVLHPHVPEVWVIHPFSLAPTSFVVRSAAGEWWGNCAWCSLGVAALLAQDVAITTALGADDRQVTVHIHGGRVVEDQYLVHFPVPMLKAWDNVIFTCSTMLLFDTEAHVDRWSARHRIAKGDVAVGAALSGLARNLGRALGLARADDAEPRAAAGAPAAAVAAASQALPQLMLAGLERSGVPALVILSGDADLTANEFRDLVARSAPWRRWLDSPQVRLAEVAGSTHTFARADWRAEVETLSADWVTTLVR